MAFVVGEIGVNWDGDFTLAKQMMAKAKKSGCNAVKFQAYDYDIVKEHPEKERLMKATISKDNIDQIDKISKEAGIEWFATPMYPDAVNLLEPYVKKFKVRVSDGRALFENKSSEIIDRIIKTKKDVIISVEKNPKTLSLYQQKNVSWLYCVSKYPCEFSDLDFSNINNFNGYSNHCPHFLAPVTAVILGAKIIEVHITSDKSKNFVDNNVSFDYDELENMIKLIRLVETMKL
jgi:N-acetylneuraminate synthase